MSILEYERHRTPLPLCLVLLLLLVVDDDARHSSGKSEEENGTDGGKRKRRRDQPQRRSERWSHTHVDEDDHERGRTGLFGDAPVVGGDEGHFGDLGGDALAADFDRELGAFLGQGGGDVAHGDGGGEAGGDGAGGDDADFGVAVEELGALASGCFVGGEADAFFREFLGLALGRQEVRGAEEGLSGAAARAGRAERPQQRGLHRVDGLVEVVAVETEAGFEAEAVAGAEAAGLDGGCRTGEELAGDVLGGVCVHRDLEAVFAGVAAARHARVVARHRRLEAVHEGELGHVEAVREERQ
mmetsp:Transcript_17116/g.52003  ORF Transcript_17116/g.52003 Transcript_17116/m.52003 type:complete len:299 (-) Transcript_17116:626-1522(-)